ncbi:MAG: hypothetical protein A2V84_12135 [Chloroflexi bacterium RBG_16_70_13]|nr:MAG: hypothetical protein A2V84_12135 [Chloroflexi bacterium RBG_16_70_13]
MTRRELPMLGPVGVSKEAEPDDPLELVGVPVPVDEATFDEMARCLVEEYVRDGWSDERLVPLFRSPFYAGLHVIFRRRGEPWVRTLIADVRTQWHRPNPVPEGGA